MKEVYLDNSATTMAYRSVGELVQKVMCEDYGNPSSMHNKGVEAEKNIKEAKETFARCHIDGKSRKRKCILLPAVRRVTIWH